MKTLAFCALLTVAAIAGSTHQDPPTPEITPQHKWLKQFVGEWDVVAETTMEPGSEPTIFRSTEKVRAIGDLWVLGEMSMSGENGFTALLTLGYDPQEKAFVGTWVDTVQTHLWTYRGELDEAQKVLTLSAEGPAFGDPTKTAKYRDSIELAGKDHKILRSTIQGEDGQWTTFMTAHYRRKK